MELKEVLHFYLGSECDFFIKLPEGFTAIGDRTVLNVRVLHNVITGLANCKPILRPLSDMTEEDTHSIADELGIITSNVFAWRNSALAGGLTHFSTQVEFINACRKRGYDCDGLINSNQAIDKAKGE